MQDRDLTRRSFLKIGLGAGAGLALQTLPNIEIAETEALLIDQFAENMLSPEASFSEIVKNIKDLNLLEKAAEAGTLEQISVIDMESFQSIVILPSELATFEDETEIDPLIQKSPDLRFFETLRVTSETTDKEHSRKPNKDYILIIDQEIASSEHWKEALGSRKALTSANSVNRYRFTPSETAEILGRVLKQDSSQTLMGFEMGNVNLALNLIKEMMPFNTLPNFSNLSLTFNSLSAESQEQRGESKYIEDTSAELNPKVGAYTFADGEVNGLASFVNAQAQVGSGIFGNSTGTFTNTWISVKLSAPRPVEFNVSSSNTIGSSAKIVEGYQTTYFDDMSVPHQVVEIEQSYSELQFQVVKAGIYASLSSDESPEGQIT